MAFFEKRLNYRIDQYGHGISVDFGEGYMQNPLSRLERAILEFLRKHPGEAYTVNSIMASLIVAAPARNVEAALETVVSQGHAFKPTDTTYQARRELGELWQTPQRDIMVDLAASRPGREGQKVRAQAIAEHRKAIVQALAEGKPVPAEVLADYPDLLETERASVMGRAKDLLDMLEKSMEEELDAFTVYEERLQKVRKLRAEGVKLPRIHQEMMSLLAYIMADEDDHFKKLKALADLLK
jgi:hypothetical protein